MSVTSRGVAGRRDAGCRDVGRRDARRTDARTHGARTYDAPTAGTQISEGAGRRSDSFGRHGAEAHICGRTAPSSAACARPPCGCTSAAPNPWVSSGPPPPSREGDAPSSSAEKAARSKGRRWLWPWARRGRRGLGALVHLVTPLDLSSLPTNGATHSQSISED